MARHTPRATTSNVSIWQLLGGLLKLAGMGLLQLLLTGSILVFGFALALTPWLIGAHVDSPTLQVLTYAWTPIPLIGVVALFVHWPPDVMLLRAGAWWSRRRARRRSLEAALAVSAKTRLRG